MVLDVDGLTRLVMSGVHHDSGSHDILAEEFLILPILEGLLLNLYPPIAGVMADLACDESHSLF